MLTNTLPAPRSNEIQPRAAELGTLDLPYGGAAAPQPNNSENELRTTLLKYVRLALKHKILLAVTCAVFLFGGLISTLMTTKIYSGSTSIKIDRTVPRVINDQRSQDDEQNSGPQFYQTQYQLIQSRMLADRVATALNLAQTDFVKSPPPGILSKLLGHAPSEKPRR